MDVLSEFGPFHKRNFYLKLGADRELQFAFVYFFFRCDMTRCARAASISFNGRVLRFLAPQNTEDADRVARAEYAHIYQLRDAECVEIANHFLGFNGWSDDILSLNESGRGDGSYEASVRVRVHKFDVTVVGTAISTMPDECDRVERMKQAQRRAVGDARCDAFSYMILVVLDGECKHIALSPEADQTEVSVDDVK